MSHPPNELASYIIDVEDEDCPAFALHLAAYLGDTDRLEELLTDPELREQVDSRIRPFLATPLRLAATAGCLENVKILLDLGGASVDLVDVKAQTPLFVALVNQHWECARYLLESGADPNGDEKNLCTPLSVMSQRGYYQGVRLLCQYGADTEDLYRLSSGLPGLPLAIAATYRHLKCFATLLLFGAKPGLTLETKSVLSSNAASQCSVPHAIIKYRCPPEFVYLFREFGGNLWLRDGRNRLATDTDVDLEDAASALKAMRYLQGYLRVGLLTNSSWT